MSDTKTQQKTKHDIVLRSRKNMSIDGVVDIISFDEAQAIFVTNCGEMTVEGTGLHISVLDLESGRVELDGNVEGVFYSDGHDDKNAGRGILARLFG